MRARIVAASHGDERAPDKHDALPQGPVRHRDLRGGRQQHQQDRHEHRHERDAKRRRPCVRGHIRELVGNRSRLDVHAPADIARINRSRDDRERETKDQRIEQRAARIGAQPLDGREWSGMRRHEAVRDRESRHERQGEPQERRARLALCGEQHRCEQHESHLEKDRQADDESRQHQRPVETPLAEDAGQRGRDDHGAARLGEQLSDHRAEANHHRHRSERVSDAGLERPRNIAQRHAGRQSDEERRHRQREKRRDAHPGDEQHDERNAKERDEEHGRGVDGGHGARRISNQIRAGLEVESGLCRLETFTVPPALSEVEGH